jgi:hypothetical protein
MVKIIELEDLWDEVIDFTKIKQEGIPIDNLLIRLGENL